MSDIQTPAEPPAGWYPDPWRWGGHRWWNGTAWTASFVNTAEVDFDDSTAPRVAPGSVNSLAIVALVLGFVPYHGAVSLVVGPFALREIARNRQRGRLPTIVGMTFGGLWLLAFLAAVVRIVTTG